jgi:outer membrane protein assembly factor BamB
MLRSLSLLFAIGLTGLTGCGQQRADTAKAAESLVSGAPSNSTGDAEALTSLWIRQRGEDWPIFLGPTQDSKSAEKGLITPWPKSGPRIVWQKEVGTGYGIGSVALGRYFHFDRRKDPGGRGMARLTCSHAETGKELWKFEYRTDYEDQLGYNNGPRASPILDGNRVYILGAEGTLHCVRASDGQLVWEVNTTEKYGVVQNFFGVGSTPAITDDLLICMVGGSPPGSPGLYQSNGKVSGNGSGVVAFNKFTGEVKYSITDELASYSSTRLATLNKRSWCFQLCRGGLLGFEPQSGKVDFFYPWRATLLESVNASMPVVIKDEVFISEAYQIGSSLLKVRPGGYDVVWADKPTSRDKSFRAHWNTPVHVDGYLYGASGRNPGDTDLRCIEWKTGKVMWSELTNDRSSMLYVDGHLINLGEYGTLQLLRVNPQKFDVVSEVILRREGADGVDPIDGGPPRLLRMPCWAAPILAHGLLYVRGDDRVVCLEVIPDGK